MRTFNATATADRSRYADRTSTSNPATNDTANSAPVPSTVPVSPLPMLVTRTPGASTSTLPAG
ncbi:hypothetical protein GCM10027605_34040 [Micromonospora zhanjiangensis]